MFATGEDVPPELFEYVLDFIDNTADIFGNSSVVMDKRDVGKCALTCRYWAQRCQPRIFDQITLRSREDVYELASFLDSPLSSVASYICRLKLEHKGSVLATPWVHLVPTLLLPKLSLVNHNPISLHLENPVYPGSIRSIHGLLPSSCPAFSASIKHVTLKDIAFRSFNHLAHLVGELPVLFELHGVNLTWPTSEAVTTLRTSTSLAQVSMSGCTNNWSVILLVTGPRRRACKDSKKGAFKLELDRTEYTFVSDWPGIIQRNASIVNILITKNRDRYHLRVQNDLLDVTPILHIVMLEYGGVMRIDGISVDFAHAMLPLDTVLSYDWKAFDEYVSSLTRLYKVTLGFSTQTDVARFVEEVVNLKLEHLRTMDKLTYAIQDAGRIKRWMKVTPGADLLEDTGTEDLWNDKRHYDAAWMAEIRKVAAPKDRCFT